ncbi:uncharacterized protein EAE97_005198 [Botrytis byssoidea]|uniref:Uncharacterized protein n=1 Tax=Botrytis byssoidea TaxID=139641 RepID=A0A9P5M335_9HELO|nr:uncharacterized protein EAE97_005198 [Botrytis byssoidea]KAF7944565.1 hypothetical protein EAE97_005198 [Botrytis byssoidea]
METRYRFYVLWQAGRMGTFFRGEVEEMVKDGEAKIRGAENSTGEDQEAAKIRYEWNCGT